MQCLLSAPDQPAGYPSAPDQALAQGKGGQRVAVKLLVRHAVANDVTAQAQPRLLACVVAVEDGLQAR
jgi:hypothetical protein